MLENQQISILLISLLLAMNQIFFVCVSIAINYNYLQKRYYYKRIENSPYMEIIANDVRMTSVIQLSRNICQMTLLRQKAIRIKDCFLVRILFFFNEQDHFTKPRHVKYILQKNLVHEPKF